MKFECPSCGKKYSLPDEKVPAGKDFKVKCKKCGEIIVLRAPDPAEAAQEQAAPPPAEQPAAEQQSAFAPPAEQPSAFAPPAEQPAAEQPSAFAPPAEQPAAEQPSAFAPPAEQPFEEQPGQQMAEGPFGQPAAEMPAPGAGDAVASPDEQPTRVFDYSRMGAEDAGTPDAGALDSGQAASAQAEAFQAAPPSEPFQEEAAPPPAAAAGIPDDVEWHIAVDGDQMGPYETAQMFDMIAANQITAETYVWRDGFDDWLPLSDVSELQGAGMPVAAAPAPTTASPGSPFAIASGGGEVGQDLFASPGGETASDSPFAAPSAGGVVASSLDAEPQSPRVDATGLKGARHENSVLFSLSSLQALASSSRDPAPGTTSAPGAATSEGGSGLIDIKSLTAGAGAGASESAPSDDILSMGGAGIGSPVGVPSLLQPAKKEPSKLPYILGGAFGLIAIASVAVVLVVVLGRNKGSEVDEEALRAQIMKELMEKGFTKEQAAEAADQQVEAQAEAGEEGEAEAGEEGEAEEEAATSTGGKKKKGGKKKGSSSGGGDEGSSTGTSPPIPSSSGGKKPSAAEDDLMKLLAGATKGGGKTPTKKQPAPTKEPTAPPKPAGPELADKPTKQQVMKALNGVKPRVQACGKGATGVATVSINIAGTTGKVASAKVVSGPFKGTPNAGCIEKAVKKAKFPKFKQAKFSVSYPFVIK
jgi:predicted Zn finger-like uncharacterized protein